jgi:hypothetical protein
MDKHEMIVALRRSISNAGIAIMNDKVKLKAYLSDFLPGYTYKSERMALLHALEIDDWKILLEVHGKKQDEHERAKKVLLTQLQDTLGWTKEHSILILECYTTAMGWKDVAGLNSQSDPQTILQPTLQPNVQPNHQSKADANSVVQDDETRVLLEYVKQLMQNAADQKVRSQQADVTPKSVVTPAPHKPLVSVTAPPKKKVTAPSMPIGSITKEAQFPIYHTANNSNIAFPDIGSIGSIPGRNKHIGSIHRFGAYDWRVLDVQRDKFLLISKDIIIEKNYNKTLTNVTSVKWKNCILRKWLNKDFLHTFSEEEQSQIVITLNTNENNQWFGTNGIGGRRTKDKIFLLSISEVVKYFGDSVQLLAKKPVLGDWIKDQFSSERIASFKNTKSGWWLRSPGCYSFTATFVSSDGDICMSGNDVNLNVGVRPALWLKR